MAFRNMNNLDIASNKNKIGKIIYPKIPSGSNGARHHEGKVSKS